jgi:hypothetical protein
MTEVAVETRFPGDIDQDEARDVLGNALHREAKWAKAKYEHFRQVCQTFERKQQLSSDEVMQRFESGGLGDDAEYFD